MLTRDTAATREESARRERERQEREDAAVEAATTASVPATPAQVPAATAHLVRPTTDGGTSGANGSARHASNGARPTAAVATPRPATQNADPTAQDATARPHQLPRPTADATKHPARPPALLSALVALGLLVVLNAVLAIPAIRRPLDVASDGFSAYARLQRCESLGHAPDVLWLGSSRTLYSADAHQVDATMRTLGHPTLSCNLGRMGANFQNDYYIFKRMIEDGVVPKLLVENLWENNLNINARPQEDGQGTNLLQIQRLADLSDMGDFQQYLGTKGLPATPDWVAGKLLPLYGERVGLLRTFCGGLTLGPCGVNTDQWDPNTTQVYARSDDRGWTPMYGSLAHVPPAKLATQARTLYSSILPGTEHFVIGGQQPEYLARMVALAKAHAVKVALVVTPVSPVYFQFFDHGLADWHMIAAYWRSFAAQHGVPLYDESQAPGYTTADFQDPHHLTASGAVKFSTWAAGAIVEPALFGKAG